MRKWRLPLPSQISIEGTGGVTRRMVGKGVPANVGASYLQTR